MRRRPPTPTPSCERLARAVAARHDHHRGRGRDRRIVHTAWQHERHDWAPAVLPGCRCDCAHPRVAHPLRGVDAAREVERQVRRRRQRRMGGHHLLRRHGGSAPARLRDRVDQYRPRGGAGVGHGPVRAREARTTHRLRVPLAPRDSGQGQEPRAGVLREAGRARVFHRLLLGRLRRPDGGPALSRGLRWHRRRRACEQLDPADGGRLRRRARGPEGSRQPPAAAGARPAASQGARRLRRP